MPFTAGELQNIANASLEYFWKKGSVFSQSLQNKPLLKAMRANKETFPGGKDEISVAVKGDYTTTIQGYSHDSVVGYQNPANIKRAKVFPSLTAPTARVPQTIRSAKSTFSSTC